MQAGIGVNEFAPPRKRLGDASGSSGFDQGDMYHIFAPQRQRQDSARFGEYHPPGFATADAPGLVELAPAR